VDGQTHAEGPLNDSPGDAALRFAGDILVYRGRSCHCVTQIGAVEREGGADLALMFPARAVCPHRSSSHRLATLSELLP
jgi:predicted 2-oxoglutarate/Fe(II)-dependent dioxygenase YbiX